MTKVICPACHQPIVLSLYQTRAGTRFLCPRCFSNLEVKCSDPVVLAQAVPEPLDLLYRIAEEEIRRS